jgi:ArsR family transcriptional regulator, arsenate/arsenite/antimonite-responsive transcriptional repressor / arsenate reductase (thioredoxin)
MKNGRSPDIFKLLSTDLRWQLLKALSQSDLRVQELTEIVGQPQNLISYHLQKLHGAGLVLEHRSIADGREIYYGINLNKIQSLFLEIQNTLHPGLISAGNGEYTGPSFKILVLCTHNSARSQMAEGFLRAKSQGRLDVVSAGADPQLINPFAIQVMAEYGIDIHSYQSKSQERYIEQSFNTVITVCDRARETCPIFPGNPILMHWSIADPTAPTISPQTQLEQFQMTAQELGERIDFFLAGIGKQNTWGPKFLP